MNRCSRCRQEFEFGFVDEQTEAFCYACFVLHAPEEARDLAEITLDELAGKGIPSETET